MTGASRGIGAATAQALAAEGWPVGINFREDREGAEQVARAIEAAGGQAVPVQADVSQPGEAERMFTELEESFGMVSVLVNNAGCRADGLSPQLKDADWDRVLATNLSASFWTTRRALSKMLRARHGRIVNISSIVGLRANPGQANYAAAKAGLVGFTKTVAAEVARRGVTVNAVAPGLVLTEMTADVADEVLKHIPARRAGTVEEVAACVRFLASEEAGYVTGVTLTVDGGMSA